MEYDGKDFVGVKAALLWNDELFVYQRDNKPGLRFAGLWDFFGGGREEHETPFECLRRELEEELEIGIIEPQVVFAKKFPAMHDATLDAYFMVVRLNEAQVRGYKFGNEGIRCKFVKIGDFMADNEAVPDLKPRLLSYLTALEKNNS